MTPDPEKVRRPVYDSNDGRLRGRNAQERRKRVWARHPYCAHCRKLVELDHKGEHPFELDHIVALVNGGKDVEANLQVLCAGPGGCHDKKTARDLGQRYTAAIDPDGWPEGM